MDVTDAIKVFEALDVDVSCALEIDEFAVGCSAIHGPARALVEEVLKLQNRDGGMHKDGDGSLTSERLSDLACTGRHGEGLRSRGV